MANKLRKVHINSIEWKYAMSNDNVRIYEPGTKQIKATVSLRDLPNSHPEDIYYNGDNGFSPADVKKYIMDNLI
jgi:hypothetical protein